MRGQIRGLVCVLLMFCFLACLPHHTLAATPQTKAWDEILDYLATFPVLENGGLLAASPPGSYSIHNGKGERVGAYVKQKNGSSEEYQYNPDGSIRRWQKIDLEDNTAVVHEMDERGQGKTRRETQFNQQDDTTKYRETFYDKGEYSHEYTRTGHFVEMRAFNRQDELVYKKHWTRYHLEVSIYTNAGKMRWIEQDWDYFPKRVDANGHPSPFRLSYANEYDAQERRLRKLEFHGDAQNLRRLIRNSADGAVECLSFDQDGSCRSYYVIDKNGVTTQKPTDGIKASDEPNYDQLRTDPNQQEAR